MRRFILVLGVVGILVPSWPLLGQQPGARAPELRRQLEQRFAQLLRDQLGLSPDQETQVHRILQDFAERRRGLERAEVTLRRALGAELRPGVAARADSVTRLVDAISENRVAYQVLLRDELRELAGVLTPVQRGQFFLMRDRVMQRIREAREAAAARAGRPGRQR